MVNCTVLRCNSRSEQGCEDVSFHRFPSDEEIRKQWIVATGRYQWTPTIFHRICSKHFKPECYHRVANKALLDKAATPTLFVHTESLMESINRRVLSMDEKLSIIRAIEAGERVSSVARRLSYCHSTVDNIWHRREKILRPKLHKKTKALKKPLYEDLDDVVFSWFQRQRHENMPISGPVLKAKADVFAMKLGIKNFKATEGWLAAFKEIHGISYCKETRSFDAKPAGSVATKLEEHVLKKEQDEEPESSMEDPLRDSNNPNSSDDDQDLLRKTIKQCRFCGDYGMECTDIFYLSFLNHRKTTIAFNELNIQIDFKSTNLPTTVCRDCNDKLLEIRKFIKLAKETQERFNLGTKKKQKKKKTVKKDEDAGKDRRIITDDDEGTKDAGKNRRIVSDNDEDTRDAFEDEDLIQCDDPRYFKHEDQIEQVVIKTEYESDNDTKEGIIDSITVEETVVSKNSKSTKEDTTKRKNDTNEGISEHLTFKGAIGKDSKTKQDIIKRTLVSLTTKENIVVKVAKKTDDAIRRKDTNEGIGSETVEETVVKTDSKRTKEDTSKRKKAKVEESVTFDIAIEEEVPLKVTSEGYSGFGTSRVVISGVGTSGVGTSGVGISGVGISGVGISGVGISGVGTSGVGTSGVSTSGVGTSGVGISGVGTSAPKRMNYITFDGLTGTLLVGHSKREDTK